MKTLTEYECESVGGGLTWDQNTCAGTAIIGGIIIGGVVGSWGGAAAGGFIGGWLGDNFCTYVI